MILSMEKSNRQYSGTCLVRPPPLIGHKNMVSQDRWSLVTGSITLKCTIFCQIYAIFQDRWSFTAVVCQDRFHCSCPDELTLVELTIFQKPLRRSHVSNLPSRCLFSLQTAADDRSPAPGPISVHIRRDEAQEPLTAVHPHPGHSGAASALSIPPGLQHTTDRHPQVLYGSNTGKFSCTGCAVLDNIQRHTRYLRKINDKFKYMIAVILY